MARGTGGSTRPSAVSDSASSRSARSRFTFVPQLRQQYLVRSREAAAWLTPGAGGCARSQAVYRGRPPPPRASAVPTPRGAVPRVQSPAALVSPTPRPVPARQSRAGERRHPTGPLPPPVPRNRRSRAPASARAAHSGRSHTAMAWRLGSASRTDLVPRRPAPRPRRADRRQPAARPAGRGSRAQQPGDAELPRQTRRDDRVLICRSARCQSPRRSLRSSLRYDAGHRTDSRACGRSMMIWPSVASVGVPGGCTLSSKPATPGLPPSSQTAARLARYFARMAPP